MNERISNSVVSITLNKTERVISEFEMDFKKSFFGVSSNLSIK